MNQLKIVLLKVLPFYKSLKNLFLNNLAQRTASSHQNIDTDWKIKLLLTFSGKDKIIVFYNICKLKSEIDGTLWLS